MKNNKNNDFDNQSFSKFLKRTQKAEPTDDHHAATKSYVDSLPESGRNRQDFSTVFNDQVNDFDKNKLSNLVSFAFIRIQL